MSRLEELISELCPNGVEYKKLNEVCNFQNGFAFKSSLFDTIGEPILRITNIKDGKISDDDYVYFDPSNYKEDLSIYIVKKDDIVVAMSGATTGKIGYNYSEKNFYLNQRVGKFIPNEDKLNNRFLFHWLTLMSNELLRISSGSGAQPNLSSIKTMELEIPVPPLPIQEEIVRILDNFTELTAELTAELQDRKKQYEYYRDSLLTFNNDIKKVKLQDFLKIKNGSDYKHLNEGTIPVYGSGGIMTYVDKYSYDKPSVLIPRKGSVDKLYYVDVPFWNVDTIFYTDIDINKANVRYVFYALQKAHLESLNIAGGVPSLTQAQLNNVEIFLPSLEIQERIVNVLDNFEKICNDLKIGLPAEIELRQKQYEYYRDKLLTFNRLN